MNVIKLCLAVVVASVSMIAQTPCAESSGFHEAVDHAKTIYVAVYYNPRSDTLDSGPPSTDVEDVIRVLRSWPLTANNDREIKQQIRQQLRSWGRFQLASNLLEADLILVVDRGKDEFISAVCMGPEDCPQRIQRDGSVSIYATHAKPGLIWRKSQAANLVDSGVRLVPEFRNDVQHTESSHDVCNNR